MGGEKGVEDVERQGREARRVFVEVTAPGQNFEELD